MPAMGSRFEGRVVIVTGGSRGIGRATALRCAREGARVVVSYRDDAPGAEATVHAITAEGGTALALAADARDARAATDMVERTLERFGRLDALVNNAGTLVMGGASEMTAQRLHDALDINVVAAMHAARAVLPAMRAAGGGAIVNVAAASALGTAAAGIVPHAAAKAALLLWTKQLALELGAGQIRVNAVCPGAIDTEVTLPGGALHEALSEVRRRQLEQTALGRTGTMQEVAAAIAFLASDDAGFITGQALTVDGGRSDYLTRSG